MNTQELDALLTRCLALPDGEPLEGADEAALRSVMQAYPAFGLIPLLLLRHASAETDIRALRARVALLCPHPHTLAFARYGDEWARFYPEAPDPEAKKTVDVIDTFLNTYGSCTPEEEALLERMIFNPTPDYAEMLAREEQVNLPAENDAPADSQEAMINAFIRSQHPAAHTPSLMPPQEGAASDDDNEPAAPVSKPQHADDGLLSESLAKIFIKQGRYERAYEIISGLNLKFPKKSAYFADQLRFLQKLIINQRQQEALKSRDASEK